MTKAKKIIIIAISIVILLIVLMLLLKNPVVYSSACKNLDEQDYKSASQQFKSLNDYKDSEEKYTECKAALLNEQIEEITSDEYLAEYKPADYHKIIDQCETIIFNSYFSKIEKSNQTSIRKYYEYIQFLDIVFNYDDNNEFINIDCESNPYFSAKLTDFYNNYYKRYEGQKWIASDKYKYYHDQVTNTIEVDTRVLLKLKDENAAFSDSNFEEYLRVYVSYEDAYKNFAESTVTLTTEIDSIQVTTEISNLSNYYDTEQYREEMGASNVAFVINFEKEQPTVKYAPDHIKDEEFHTLSLILQ